MLKESFLHGEFLSLLFPIWIEARIRLFAFFVFAGGLPAFSFAQVIAGGGYHSIAVCTDNTAWSWGGNGFGALGDNSTTDRLTPVQVSGLTGITSVAGGEYFSLFVKNDGTAWACGLNNNGRLGDGTTTQRNTPVQVSGLTGVIAAAAGQDHSVFLKNDGTAWACGLNASGNLGDGTTVQKLTPVQVSGLTGVIAVAAGWRHSVFVKSNGTVWACGRNNVGQLGDNSTSQRLTVVQVSGLTGITAAVAGQDNSLFLKNDGTAWASGCNCYGELGDGTTTNRITAVQVSGLTGVTAISGGYYFSLFLKNDGTAWGCGLNDNAQLGDGTTTTPHLTAVQVSGLTGITAVEGGSIGYHSIFLKNDLTVWDCGANGNGQLGDGTTITPRTTAVQVNGLCNVALPIELLSFSANPYKGNSVICSWATASEINNDYFTLEKSLDAVNFTPFVNMDGAGHSSTTLYYQYIDSDPHIGLSYYRLKQTDFNGSFSYSNIDAVYFGSIDLISIYPNPGSEFIFYTLASEKEGQATLKVYDVLGREVFSREEMIEKGVVTKKLNVSTLSSGSYLLRITTKLQEKVQKQLVVR